MARENEKDDEKTVDLPPYGPRNADPITDAPGSHPIETGVGAALGGAATGAALGVAIGPPGVVLGTLASAIAGGFAGKGVGELIDPTTEDNWIREYFDSDTSAAKSGRTREDYRPAYRYGLASRDLYTGRSFDAAEAGLRAGWDKARGDSRMTWDEARRAVRHACDRTIQLKEAHRKADK